MNNKEYAYWPDLKNPEPEYIVSPPDYKAPHAIVTTNSHGKRIKHTRKIFKLLSDNQLAKLGFYPVNRSDVTITDYQDKSITWSNDGKKAIESITVSYKNPDKVLDLAQKSIKRAKQDLSTTSEKLRKKYMDPNILKQQVYREKRDEVIRYKNDSNPVPENYPWASARATVLGVKLVDVIQEWSGKVDYWAEVGIMIESAYDKAVKSLGQLTLDYNTDRGVKNVMDEYNRDVAPLL